VIYALIRLICFDCLFLLNDLYIIFSLFLCKKMYLIYIMYNAIIIGMQLLVFLCLYSHATSDMLLYAFLGFQEEILKFKIY
jgi:hypothetical protein